MQPPYQPSGNGPASSDSTHLFADPARANTLPAQTATTIGDALDARGIAWKWYAGAYAADITAGTLPQVTFFKPQGNKNQHAGYASLMEGDAYIADLIGKLQAGPQYKNMVIILTYDENGGWWDHAAPPKGDLIGPGTRIPAIVVSPFAKKGTVDHTQYDTASIQRFLNRRFGLAPLAGITARDAALVSHGGVAMGDLTNALTF
jgi:acid phosphatase